MTAPAGTHRRSFADVSAVVAADPGRFEAEIDADWTIGGKPNGGYLLAVMARAAIGTVDHEHVSAASAHYLRSPDPGPVTIETTVLRAGRSASQVHTRMTQAGRSCVEALITLTTIAVDAAPYWSRDMPAPAAPPVSGSVRIGGVLPDGNPVAIMDQVEVILDADTAGFTIGAPSGRGELRGWLTLPGDEPFGPVSLLYALDALPPASFDIKYAGWVPTLELTAYVRAIPAVGPVSVLQRANLITDGRVDETCLVWDSQGQLVAHGSQLAGVRLS